MESFRLVGWCLCLFLFGSSVQHVAAKDLCHGPYPSYWQHPTNQPPAGASREFSLSQNYPVDEPADERLPWDHINPFEPGLMQTERDARSLRYLGALLDYVLEGNLRGKDPSEDDFNPCMNEVRDWFHVPWMDRNASKGREYVHGLTRELAAEAGKLSPGQQETESSWAVAMYNAKGGYQIGKIFGADGTVTIPEDHILFPDGTVVVKLLFTTTRPESVPYLRGAPEWTANIAPASCRRDVVCTRVECKRTLQVMRLLQIDVATVDRRAPRRWVFGSYLYNGSDNRSGWDALVPLGLGWGNDPGVMRPTGHDPSSHEPKYRGLTNKAMLAESSTFPEMRPAYLRKDLGCAGRLNGPADNPISSCISCHQTASVPLRYEENEPSPCAGNDEDLTTVRTAYVPLADFRQQCRDDAVDAIWFRNLGIGEAVDHPAICNGKSWISLDYSLQLTDALENYLMRDDNFCQIAEAVSPPNSLLEGVNRVRSEPARLSRERFESKRTTPEN